jgi:hypothetical protein
VRFALIAALKDLRRRLADPAALLMWVGLPVVIGGLMSLVGGDNGPQPKARLLLVDLDQTFVSGLVARAGSQGQLAEFLEIQPVTADVGQRRIDAGDASPIVVPKKFQDGVCGAADGADARDESRPRILPGILEEGLRMAIEAAFYAQRLFGQPIREIVDALPAGATGPSDDAVASVSRSINQRLRALEGTLLPPVIAFETRTEAASADSELWCALSARPAVPGVALYGAGHEHRHLEKLHGTLRRAQHAAGPTAFLLGNTRRCRHHGRGHSARARARRRRLQGADRAPLALAWAAFSGRALLCYFLAISSWRRRARRRCSRPSSSFPSS